MLNMDESLNAHSCSLLRRARRFGRRNWKTLCCATLLSVMLGSFGIEALLRHQIGAITSVQRMTLPEVKVSVNQLEKLEAEINQAATNSRMHQGDVHELLLTAEDINSLLYKEPRFRGNLYVKIVGGKLLADVSVPADSLPGGLGRYFNAEVEVDVAVQDGRLRLSVHNAMVDGEPVAKILMNQFAHRDFAKPLYNDPQIAALLENVNDVVVDDSGLRFQLRRSANSVQMAMHTRRFQDSASVQ